MKKLVFLLSIVLYLSNFINASSMEKKYEITLQQRIIEKRQVIPSFSLKDIAIGYGALECEDKKYVRHNLSKSMLFSLAICPQEIRRKILTSMLDDDAESAKEFDKKPIFAAFGHYTYVKRYAPLEIGPKVYSAGRLFRLSKQEMDKLIQVDQPFALVERVMGRKNIVVNQQSAEILSKLPRDMNSGLELKIIDRNCSTPKGLACGGLFGGCLLIGGIYLPCAAVVVGCWGGVCSTFYYWATMPDAEIVTL